jgi:hypothetical protein
VTDPGSARAYTVVTLAGFEAIATYSLVEA